MGNVIDTLTQRGFIEQTTHDRELAHYVENERVTCYIGFDPTASSLHVGSLVPIMSLAHMQRAGHRPIALVGGGTGLVGDPSGKTEMRKILTLETVNENAEALKAQLSNFLDFPMTAPCWKTTRSGSPASTTFPFYGTWAAIFPSTG